MQKFRAEPWAILGTIVRSYFVEITPDCNRESLLKTSHESALKLNPKAISFFAKSIYMKHCYGWQERVNLQTLKSPCYPSRKMHPTYRVPVFLNGFFCREIITRAKNRCLIEQQKITGCNFLITFSQKNNFTGEAHRQFKLPDNFSKNKSET